MEEIIRKREVPSMPEGIQIQMASRGALPSQTIQDISELGIQKIVENVRTGKYHSVMMAPDEDNEEGFLMMESLDRRAIWEPSAQRARQTRHGMNRGNGTMSFPLRQRSAGLRPMEGKRYMAGTICRS